MKTRGQRNGKTKKMKKGATIMVKDLFEVLETNMIIDLSDPIIEESKIDELDRAWSTPGYYIYVKYNADYHSAFKILIYASRKYNDCNAENITSKWKEIEHLLREEQIPAGWVMNTLRKQEEFSDD